MEWQSVNTRAIELLKLQRAAESSADMSRQVAGPCPQRFYFSSFFCVCGTQEFVLPG